VAGREGRMEVCGKLQNAVIMVGKGRQEAVGVCRTCVAWRRP